MAYKTEQEIKFDKIITFLTAIIITKQCTKEPSYLSTQDSEGREMETFAFDQILKGDETVVQTVVAYIHDTLSCPS